MHYREIGLHKWDNDRVMRLCRFLGCTQFELSALCAIERETMCLFIRKNSYPMHVALHFAILESWYLETFLKLPQQPIMPANLLSL
jgi:hypothetical protein